MALPGDLSTVTITFGPYTDAAGAVALVGKTAKLFPVNPVNNKRLNLVHVATGQAVLPEDLVVTIGSDGTGSVGPVPHTDNAGLSTVGFAYRVEWGLTSSQRTASPGNKTFAVPTAAGATVDFDLLDVADAVPGVLVPVGVGPEGPEGPEGPQGPPGTNATLVAAPTGIAATDTAVLQAAIDGGGLAQLRAGTYIATGLQIKTNSTLRGEGVGATTIKLADGANGDLITVPNFATLNAGNTSGGENKWAIEHLTLDGNGANQTGTSWPLRVYAYNYRIDDVQIENGLSGNAYSKWGNSAGGDMEAVWTRFKLLAPVSNTAVNLDWNGPHDSIFDGGEVVAHPQAVTKAQTGIWSRGNAGGDQFVNVHVWGFHQYGWIAEHTLHAVNCDAEGAYGANVVLLAGRCRFRGRVFGSNDANNATAVGVQIGDGTHTVMGCHVDVDTFGWVAGAFPFNFADSGGKNRIEGVGVLGGATAAWTGTINATDLFDMVFQDGTQDQSKKQTPQPLNIRSVSTSAFAVGQLNYNATAFNLDLRGGGLVRGYKSDNTTQVLRLDHSIGAIVPGTTAGTGSQIFSGTGAPSISATAGDFYFRKDTPSTAGQRLYVNTANGVNWVPVDSIGATPTDVQVFTATTATWTKPAGAVAVNVMCIGGGGGGGSGGRFASGLISCGGGGGGGGGLTQSTFSAAALPSTVAVAAGIGGVGGAARTTDSTVGATSTAAGVSTFGTFLQAGRGGTGSGGGNGVAGGNGGGGAALALGGNGAASVAAGTVPSPPSNSVGAPGGGAGGGITAALAASAGSAGAISNLQAGVTAGAGGTVGAGQAGGNGNSVTAETFGTGGGGGAANATAAAGAGGNGGSYGAGGGGGGASLNGFASGKGGDGGPGIVVVVTTF